jgi:hypothetical protein
MKSGAKKLPLDASLLPTIIKSRRKIIYPKQKQKAATSPPPPPPAHFHPVPHLDNLHCGYLEPLLHSVLPSNHPGFFCGTCAYIELNIIIIMIIIVTIKLVSITAIDTMILQCYGINMILFL